MTWVFTSFSLLFENAPLTGNKKNYGKEIQNAAIYLDLEGVVEYSQENERLRDDKRAAKGVVPNKTVVNFGISYFNHFTIAR